MHPYRLPNRRPWHHSRRPAALLGADTLPLSEVSPPSQYARIMEAHDLDEQLAATYQGKKWIVAVEAAAAATELVDRLRSWGADDVMVVAGTEGVGQLPVAVPIFSTRTTGTTVMQGVRAYLASIDRSAADLVAAVDAFDPDRRARVIGSQFLRAGEVVGRPVYGGRSAPWAALEDKMIIDDLWDRAGVSRAPSEVVSVADAPAAASRLAGPQGSVWVADNSGGWHGGAEYTRWLPDAAGARDAVEWFAPRCRLLRVMPFLDGIPCSIHGFVASDGTAVFRPVEMMILRRTDRPAFVYAGMATFWDPPTEVRRQMRHAVRSVAAELSSQVGYRGGFSVDGVCTRSGFRPTELNPRLSPGLEMQARTVGIPLSLASAAYVAGDLDISAPWLESLVVTVADARRTGGMGLPVSEVVAPADTGVVFSDAGAQPADPAGSDAFLEVGPAVSGSYVRMKLDPERIPPGPSVGPMAVAAAALAARIWGFELPGLEPAPDRCLDSHAK